MNQNADIKQSIHAISSLLIPWIICSRGDKCSGITKAKIIPNIYNPGEIKVEFGRETSEYFFYKYNNIA